MQSDQKLIANSFLKNYHSVLSHHMNCILESRMMLDEDLHLLLTFWSPPSKTDFNTSINSAAACTVSAITGAIIAAKINRLYPLIAALMPTFVELTHKTQVMYYKRKYKQNCEKLLTYLNELRELNTDVLDYNRKVMLNIPKMSESGLTLLINTKREFLKFTTQTLVVVLQQLIESMQDINKLVPVMEGEYMYAGEWNLKLFLPEKDAELAEMLHKFENLSDLSVLIVSNFLGCVGLTFCIQLWKDNAVYFRNIFDVVIPKLCFVLKTSVKDIRNKFSTVCYTLINSEDRVRKLQLHPKRFFHLQKPLDDFLFNTQVVFEAAKRLQLLLSLDDRSSSAEDVLRLTEDINQQFVACSDSLNAILKLRRKPDVCNEMSNITVASRSFITPVEVHHDDPEPLLEDEEYTLSIHGSDDDDLIAPIIDYADQCSSECLEVMLVELKRKLDERNRKKNPKQNNVERVTQNDPPEIPAPPPPPVIPCLPVVDNAHRNFLDALRTVAQNLNREEEFQFGFNMFPEIPRPFNTTYRCYSVAMLPGNERQDVERGGKIIMPPSALEQLTRLNINYPMLFKIVNKKTSRTSHCGVLEFVADEGKVYLPLWMMHNLMLEEADLLQIESVSLPVGKFAKFQPLSPEFLDITNPKAVLENCLRTFACLTTGDVIAVKYNQRSYELCVLETQPGNAISIIECDMNVEFAAPIGYKEAEETKPSEEEMVVDPADLMPEPTGFVAFKGTGNRLDGKRRKDASISETPVQKPVYVRGIPDYDYQIGTLRFLRNYKLPTINKEELPEFKVFGGKGFSLKRGT